MTRPRGTKDEFFDLLTGLPNRWRFEKRLQQIMLGSEVREKGVALVLIEVLGVGLANRMFGFMAGDALVREASQVISTVAPPTALVGRLDGNEFGVLLTDFPVSAEAEHAPRHVPLNPMTPPETPLSMACRQWTAEMLTAVNMIELSFEGHPVWVKGLAGLSFCPSDGDNGPLLMRQAYLALDQAKTSPDPIQRYSPDMVGTAWDEFTLRRKGYF